MPVPRSKTYGSAKVPAAEAPEKVAATPDEVMSRAPFQSCDGQDGDGRAEREGEVGDGDAHLGGGAGAALDDDVAAEALAGDAERRRPSRRRGSPGVRVAVVRDGDRLVDRRGVEAGP